MMTAGRKRHLRLKKWVRNLLEERPGITTHEIFSALEEESHFYSATISRIAGICRHDPRIELDNPVTYGCSEPAKWRLKK